MTQEKEISNVRYGFSQAINMKNQIIIDTGSPILVIFNPLYCDKLEKSDKVLDLVTDGGVIQSGLKYEVEKLREAWFNKNSLTNIFSFTNLVNKSRIKYDSKI